MSRLRTMDPAVRREIERMGLVVEARASMDDLYLSEDRTGEYQSYLKRQLAYELGRKIEEYADFERFTVPDYLAYRGRSHVTAARVVIMSEAELALLMSRQFVTFR